MEFVEILKKMTASVNEELDRLVPEQENLQADIYKAMRYSLLAGGKRIRPVLTLAYADILNVSRDVVLPFACALEMIHTYSLIHDDLPAMDNDDLRRGRPTCHKQFNEALAILAGDALLNRAFEVMAEACERMAPTEQIKGIRMLAAVGKMSGSDGMIGGQVVDLDSEGKPVTEETVRYMYRLKTGCLLKAPALIAIAAAGAESTEAAAHLLGYTETVGLAFQIKDDILDVEGDAAILGKKTGQDAKEEKSSMTAVMGVPYCKTLLQDLTKQAMTHADFFGDRGAFLRDMASYLLVREN